MSSDPEELRAARDRIMSNPLIQAMDEAGPAEIKEALQTIRDAEIGKIIKPDSSAINANAINAAQDPSGEVKSIVELNLKQAESLGEAIRMSVGAASVCWSDMKGTGVFLSEQALDIATQLEHDIIRRMGDKRYPKEDGDVVHLGAGVFIAKDGSVLSYGGQNFLPQAEVERRVNQHKANISVGLTNLMSGNDEEIDEN
jgi:hypothetical protein